MSNFREAARLIDHYMTPTDGEIGFNNNAKRMSYAVIDFNNHTYSLSNTSDISTLSYNFKRWFNGDLKRLPKAIANYKEKEPDLKMYVVVDNNKAILARIKASFELDFSPLA